MAQKIRNSSTRSYEISTKMPRSASDGDKRNGNGLVIDPAPAIPRLTLPTSASVAPMRQDEATMVR